MQKSACSVECTNVTIQLQQHRIQNIQHIHHTGTQDIFKVSKQLLLNIEGISRCADTVSAVATQQMDRALETAQLGLHYV